MKKKLGRTPRLVAADAGFYTAKNETAAKEKGVQWVCVPNRSTLMRASHPVLHFLCVRCAGRQWPPVLLPDAGGVWIAGFRVHRCGLAAILLRIQRNGGQSFWLGGVAESDDGVGSHSYEVILERRLVKSTPYTKPAPNWTAASLFNVGAYEYLTFGGYNSSDDIIDEFTVFPQ